MSLREEYFELITKGLKHYEYRKKYVDKPTLAYIYLSKTKKKIVAIIEFDKPIYGSAEEIANIAENDCKGNYQSVYEYIGEKGFAIPVKDITLIKEVSLVELKKVFGKFSPPQSYYYLDNKRELYSYIMEKTES